MINLDPDGQLSAIEWQYFIDIHSKYDYVFNNKFGKYNDASGRIRASINMNSVDPPPPPPQNGRLPTPQSYEWTPGQNGLIRRFF